MLAVIANSRAEAAMNPIMRRTESRKPECPPRFTSAAPNPYEQAYQITGPGLSKLPIGATGRWAADAPRNDSPNPLRATSFRFPRARAGMDVQWRGSRRTGRGVRRHALSVSESLK
jgi:hypothetical protein